MATQTARHHIYHSIDPVVIPDCVKSHEEDAAQTLLQLHRPILYSSPSMSSLASQLSVSSASSSPISFSSKFSPACATSPSLSLQGTQLPPLHFILSSDRAFPDHPHPSLPPIDRRMYGMINEVQGNHEEDDEDCMSDDRTVLTLPALKRKMGVPSLHMHDSDDSSETDDDNRSNKYARSFIDTSTFTSPRPRWGSRNKKHIKTSSTASPPSITIVDFTHHANKNGSPLSKPRWQESERLNLLEAIVQDKQLDDMSTFRWDRISMAVGRAKKACKDQWRREVLPGLAKSLKHASSL